MYGQKQILQCMAVAIVLAIFNFHRQAIKHNREVSKHKLIIKRETNLKDRPSDMEKTTITSTTAAMTDYCVRYPFGGNIYENYQSDCQPICVKSIESWMKQQCEINCCIERMANITIGTPHKTLTQRGQTLKTNRMLKTRNCEKKPITIFDENGASLHNQPFESVKTIIEPINEKFMSYVQNEEEHQCKIRTDVEFICKNTSAHTVDFVKLDTNKTKIMEYNDFLFDMGATIPRKAEAQSLDRSFASGFFAFISVLLALLTIRYMFKLFMTDHNDAFMQVLEMRRTLNDRLEEIQAELRAQEIIDNNNDVNSLSESTTEDEEKEKQDKRTEETEESQLYSVE